MTIYEYGNPEAEVVLIQPVGDHDLPEIENEVMEIGKLVNEDFQFIAVKVDSWNQELTPPATMPVIESISSPGVSMK